MDKIKKYLMLFWFLAITITYINCDGELIVMDQPESLKFFDQRPLYSSELKFVFGTILGYLDQDEREWQDLHIQRPIDFTKVVLVVAHIPGIRTIDTPAAIVRIPLMVDEHLNKTFEEIHPETTTLFKTSKLKPSVIRFDMEKNSEVYPIGETEPNPLVHAGYRLYDVVFKEIRNKKDTNHSSFVWAEFPTYDESTKEKYKPVFESINAAFRTFHELSQGFKNVKTVIVVLTHEDKVSNTRRKRQVDVDTPTAPPVIDISSLNLADDYDENFPVIFNIMLWFSVSLLFSLIAICMVIASMDPGRDSIIYRMTSTRMKKDN